MKLVFLSVLVALVACEPRPKKSSIGLKTPGSSQPTADAVFPEFLESADTYISIGSYLEKELLTADTSDKSVKVFVLMRQENSIAHNFDTLKSAIVPANATVNDAVDAAKKAGYSTVEFEVELKTLKSSLPMLGQAVSAIEVSLDETRK